MDLNGDKIPDILSGSYSITGDGPMAGHFYVFWGKEGNVFQKAEALQGTDGKPLEINPKDEKRSPDSLRVCTRPTAVDWDNDGDLDLVVGNFKGSFALFTGEGKGKFNPNSDFLKVDDKVLIVEGYHSDPIFTDWDGDGDLDLLSGSGNGGAYWAENVAGSGKPILLKGFKVIIEAKARGRKPLWYDEAPQPDRSARIFADDINGDGKMDLLLGDRTSIKLPFKGLTVKEASVKEELWQKQMDALEKRIDAEKDKEVRDQLEEEIDTLDYKYEEIVIDQSTGHVWLYIRK